MIVKKFGNIQCVNDCLELTGFVFSVDPEAVSKEEMDKHAVLAVIGFLMEQVSNNDIIDMDELTGTMH